ncbi:type II toxin-antitoxin system RelE/ParE family toxin [Mucilaginibacter sp.]|uniref:type II toxin-antitoxin system RelE/ParE family toxin n=1 Tax=Mucilaginibacter sp. TaxID=1882438 RepID=UPI00261A1D3A|nr:type II toxin-antitoxin system RelE/ParE family toxin [Mucilaginibacter sp.]
MSYAVDLFLKARKELFETREWYEEKQPGLGKRFEDEVFRKIYLIQNNPLHYPSKNGFREIRIDVFPYLLVYKVVKSSNMIFIVTTFHMSRHPKRKY